MAAKRAGAGKLALLILVIGGAASYGLLVGKPGPEPTPTPELAPPTVQVLAAQPVRRTLSVETQGTVRPLRQIRLMSQVGGRVVEVAPRFAQGGFFAADEMLVRVEEVDYELQIARAESQVAGAAQRLAEEKGRALQARREWRDLGTDEANALFLRKPQIAAAEASLRAAEADLESAKLDLARTRIAAPFNGRISEKLVDIGQFVSPGTHIATVYATDAVEVRLPLTGRQVALLDLPLSYESSRVIRSADAPEHLSPADKPVQDGDSADDASGPAVSLRATFANREWHWQGRVVRTDASIDENSRVVYAVAEVEKPFTREQGSERPPLSPGLFVNATITGREIDGVTELPRSALRNDGAVLLVDGEQRAQRREVRVLDSQGGLMWVQGLSPGEQVIVRSPQSVIVGLPVSVEDAAELAGGES